MRHNNKRKNIMKKAGFGGGCHWCTEAVFMSIKGVEKVEQGWVASNEENDSFSEAVIVHFDSDIISFENLIEIHLNTHSCTANHSMREKYRSAVYAFSEEQGIEAEEILRKLQNSFEEKIITQILPFVVFKLNKEEQLNYYQSNPNKPFCKTIIDPKFLKLKKNFNQHLK